MNTQRTPQVTLYGNLGADPETKTSKGRTLAKETYDPIIDEVRVEEFTTRDRELRTASLAVNYVGSDGEDLLRWVRLVDFQEHLVQRRKGDRLKVRGYFRDRKYLDKDGQTKTIREFVLTSAELQSLKIRHDDSVPKTPLGQAKTKRSRAKKAA
jgi:single-stranded DNA-binding protein